MCWKQCRAENILLLSDWGHLRASPQQGARLGLGPSGSPRLVVLGDLDLCSLRASVRQPQREEMGRCPRGHLARVPGGRAPGPGPCSGQGAHHCRALGDTVSVSTDVRGLWSGQRGSGQVNLCVLAQLLRLCRQITEHPCASICSPGMWEQSPYLMGGLWGKTSINAGKCHCTRSRPGPGACAPG